MTFSEYVNENQRAYTDYADTFNKCLSFVEAAHNAYNLSLKEAELKVIEESGEVHDLLYLQEEASEGFIVKIKNALAKILKDFIEWINNPYG